MFAIHRPTPVRPYALPYIQREVSVIQSTNELMPSTSIGYLPLCTGPCERFISNQLGGVSTHTTQSTFSPSLSNTTSSSETSSTNRMSYPREFKLMVAEHFLNNGKNKYRTCKQFHITKSMLNGWLHKIDSIRASRPGSLKSGRSGRKPQYPLIEKQLYKMYIEMEGSGKKMGNRWLREMARVLAIEQSPTISMESSMPPFSERWLSNFKKRYGIQYARDPDAANSVKFSSETSVSSHDKGSSPVLQPVDSNYNKKTTSTMITSQSSSIATELLARVDQAPIEAFYERFPSSLGAYKHALDRSHSTPGPGVLPGENSQILYQRYFHMTMQKTSVNNKWLQDEARKIAGEVCPELLQNAQKGARSLFSDHWLHNFKRRFGISTTQIESAGFSVCEQTQLISADGNLFDTSEFLRRMSPWFININKS